MPKEPPRYLPTPDRITRACAEIQATWTDADREERWLGRSRRAAFLIENLAPPPPPLAKRRRPDTN